METATFSMDNTVSMEPRKASAVRGAQGLRGNWGTGLLGAGAGQPGGPAPLGLEWVLLLRPLEDFNSRPQDPAK